MLLQRCRSVSPPSVFIVTIILIVRWRAAPSLASPSSWKGIARTTRAIITERARPTDVGAAPAARGTNVETQCFGIFFFFLNCEEFVLGWVHYVCCCFPLWMWWVEFRAVLQARPLADATLLPRPQKSFPHFLSSIKTNNQTSSFLQNYVQIGTAGADMYHNCVYSSYFQFSWLPSCLTWLNLDCILQSPIWVWNPIRKNLFWKVSDEGKRLHKMSLMPPPHFKFKERGVFIWIDWSQM